MRFSENTRSSREARGPVPGLPPLPDRSHCDGLVSLPKTALTDYMGSLGPQKLAAFHVALKIALDLLD